ncbi:hypothetical protein LBMAG53_38510 [Planctomycetota bacterium]|nr:hypothetical protein LBMAG53_38510 [Planctomycetota bacterium]
MEFGDSGTETGMERRRFAGQTLDVRRIRFAGQHFALLMHTALDIPQPFLQFGNSGAETGLERGRLTGQAIDRHCISFRCKAIPVVPRRRLQIIEPFPMRVEPRLKGRYPSLVSLGIHTGRQQGNCLAISFGIHRVGQSIQFRQVKPHGGQFVAVFGQHVCILADLFGQAPDRDGQRALVGVLGNEAGSEICGVGFGRQLIHDR